MTSKRNDPILNKAKNRIDDADRYFAVDFDEVKNFAKPDGIGKRKRSTWSQEATDAVAKSEGIPIRLEGFLVLTKKGKQLLGAIAEGEELCNCQERGGACRLPPLARK